MAIFFIAIRTDNDAFEDDRDSAIARILEQVGDMLAAGTAPQTGIVRDINGNSVGRFGLTNPNGPWWPALEGLADGQK